jgi:filamentous hemagglutinin
VLEVGKYGSNNGFDHVYKVGEKGKETLLIVDSKQIKNSSFQLGTPGYGTQLSEDWIEITAGRLPDGPTKQAVQEAIKNQTPIKTAVAGQDKKSGEFMFIVVNVDG